MGQLEKYGLYVLCLVIFLILGVALWGDPAPANAGNRGASMTQLDANGAGPEGTGNGGAASPIAADDAFMKRLLAANGDKGKPEPKNKDGTKADTNKAEPKADAGKDAPKTEPQASSVRPTYRIQDGDYLETIARKKLGDPRLVAAIKQLNPKLEERSLKVGSEIVLPSPAELQQLAGHAATPKGSDAAKGDGAQPAAAGTKSYTIAKNDTFEAISMKLFKTRARADDIGKLNPKIDPHKLRLGQQILVPSE